MGAVNEYEMPFVRILHHFLECEDEWTRSGDWTHVGTRELHAPAGYGSGGARAELNRPTSCDRAAGALPLSYGPLPPV